MGCKHSMIVLGAKAIVRRRIEAGWEPERAKVQRGLHGFCKKCMEVTIFERAGRANR